MYFCGLGAVPVDSGSVFCYVVVMSYQDNCLSGVVGSFDENWERERIEMWFWRDRYMRHQEVRLDENGKIIFDHFWGPTLEEWKEAEERRVAYEKDIENRLKNWRPPSVDDIIKSSVNQFKQGVKIEKQQFVYEWSMEYLQKEGIKLAHICVSDPKRRLGVAHFDMLKFMKAYDIEFDGATYKVGDKSYILMDLLETDKT